MVWSGVWHSRWAFHGLKGISRKVRQCFGPDDKVDQKRELSGAAETNAAGGRGGGQNINLILSFKTTIQLLTLVLIYSPKTHILLSINTLDS